MAFADASVEVTADFARFNREFPTRLRAAINRATRTIDTAFRRAGNAAAREFSDAFLGRLRLLLPRIARIGAQAGRAFAAAAESFTSGIDVDFDTSGAAAAGLRAGRLFRRGAELSTRNIPAGFSRGGARGLPVGGVAGIRRIGSVLGTSPVLIAAVTAAVAAFAGPLSTILGQLLSLVGLLTLLPGAIGGVVAAIAVIGAASSRLGDLISNRLTPAFAGLSDQIAAVATAGLGDRLAQIGQALSGPVRSGALDAAGALNRLLDNVAGFAASDVASRAVESIFATVTAAFDRLAEAAPAFLGGIANLLTAVAPVLDALVSDFAAFIADFGRFLSEAAAGGRAFEWAQTASQVLGSLLGVIGNLGRVLFQVFEVAAQVGGDLLGSLNEQLGRLSEFLSTAAGQEALTGFFEDLQEISAALLPFLESIVVVIPSLVRFVAALAPVLELLGQLSLVSALAVSIPALRGLASVLDELEQPIRSLIGPLADFADDARDLESVNFDQIGEQISAGFGAALAAVGGFFTGLGQRIEQAFNTLVQFGLTLPERIGRVVLAAFDAVLQGIGFAIGSIVVAVLTLPRRLQAGFQAVREGFARLVVQIGQAIAALPQVIGEVFTRARAAAVEQFTQLADRVLEFVRGLPARIAAFGPAMLEAGRRLIGQLARGLGQLARISGDFAERIIGRIRDFINRAIGSIEAGINRAVGAIGINVDLRRLQHGAVIREPTLALLGEGGDDEVVIPLGNRARAQALADESGLSGLLAQPQTAPVVNVRVFVGSQELTDIVRVQADQAVAAQGEALLAGPRLLGA